MRTLTVNELHIVNGGYSGWEVAGLSLLSTLITTGAARLYKGGTLTQALEVAGACGFLSTMTVVLLLTFLGHDANEADLGCVCE